MPTIVTSNSITNLEASNRTDISNCLVLTGGGTNQTFFSCGAVGCLVDNGLFIKGDKGDVKSNFEVISAVSGGTLLLTLIDLCTSPIFKYWEKEDWYNRYVRKNMYNFTRLQIVPSVIKNGINPWKLQTYIFRELSDFDKPFDQENKNIICEYNYIDSDRKQVTCDNTDIIDIANKVKKDFWYIIRPLRCTMPFTNFYDRPTYDAGAIANIPVNSIFTRYNPENIIIIEATPLVGYDVYPKQTYVDLVTNALGNIMAAANNSLQDMIDLNTINCKGVIYCAMSNTFLPSQDQFHNGLFSDWEREASVTTRFYNGFIYNDETLMRIIENEGYIQMYYALKNAYPDKDLVFKIPNIEVYNSNVKNLVKESLNKNIAFEMLKEVITTPFL